MIIGRKRIWIQIFAVLHLFIEKEDVHFWTKCRPHSMVRKLISHQNGGWLVLGVPTWNYLADSIYRLCSLDSPNVSLCILVNHFKQAAFTRLSAALADISSWQAASLQNCQCGFKLALGLHAWKRKTEKIYEIWSPKWSGPLFATVKFAAIRNSKRSNSDYTVCSAHTQTLSGQRDYSSEE